MNTPDQPEAPVETPSHTPTRADVHTPATDALTTLHDTLRTPTLPSDAAPTFRATPRVALLIAEMELLRLDLARAERERDAANKVAAETLRARDLDRAELRSVRAQRDEMAAAIVVLCEDLARTEQERETLRADLARTTASHDECRRAYEYLQRIRGGL